MVDAIRILDESSREVGEVGPEVRVSLGNGEFEVSTLAGFQKKIKSKPSSFGGSLFQRQPDSWRLYAFPSFESVDCPIALLLFGIRALCPETCPLALKVASVRRHF